MKHILSAAVLFFICVTSAQAAAPDTAQNLLRMGNQKFVQERSLGENAPTICILADPAITADPATIFGLDAARLTVVRPGTHFGPQTDVSGLNTATLLPLYMILGIDEAQVWAVYESVLGQYPQLIYAVMKGQTSVVGATFDSATGLVTELGTHPDLLVMAAQHVLGTPEAEIAEDAPADATESTPETPSTQEAETSDTNAAAASPEQEAETPAPETDAVAAPAAAPADHTAAHTEAEGGASATVILLFIIALVGVVIFMDRTVLKA